MLDTLEAASAQMRMISTELEHSVAGSLAETVALANHIGERLVRRVQAHASGRPGPRVITGAYLQSITYEVITTGRVVDINVGSNAPQAMRLEMGFVGVDSLGRHYDQPPYPHFRPAADEMEHEFEETMAGAIVLDTLA